jgi:hypothetical protein
LSYNYSTAIGYQATINASNQIVFGTSSENVKIPGPYVGIGGVYNPLSGYALDVFGNLNTTADSYINGVRVGRGVGNFSSNTAVGATALQSNTSGSNNVAVGFSTLQLNTTGSSNVAVGFSALQLNTTGSSNVAVGFSALTSNTTGSSNLAVGLSAIKNNITGSNNVALGHTNGNNNISGSFNTFLGDGADVASTSLIYNNSTALGVGVTIDASNQIVLGRSSESVKIPGYYVGIGNVYNPSSGYALDVFGNVNVNGNFFINQNTIPPTISTQLGYQVALPITTATTLSTGITSLVLPPTLPKGVWIVEGFAKHTLNAAATCTLGLSQTIGTFELTRTIIRYISTSLTFAEHITSVFVLSAPTTIYLLGQLSNSTSQSPSSNTITYTRIG